MYVRRTLCDIEGGLQGHVSRLQWDTRSATCVAELVTIRLVGVGGDSGSGVGVIAKGRAVNEVYCQRVYFSLVRP